MARKPAKPSPVFKVEFEDRGQEFSHWFVQNRTVIDCTPSHWRRWCGTRIARVPAPGQVVRILSRVTHQFEDFDAPVIAVEQLSEEQAVEVTEQWRQRRRELLNE